tara:strand:+ start:84 stop:302 length:219 start_codon:yes stop_codon:yes gene_type:complete
MGFLDDMADDIKNTHAKPKGFVTVLEWAAKCGIGERAAQYKLTDLCRRGKIHRAAWFNPSINRTCYVYGDKK